MSVAIRTAVRIQDQDDAPSLGAGQNGYALTWDNASGAFVATALVTDHGALTGLSDDDHTQYALLAGRSGGQTLYGGTAANDDITIHGTSNGTRATSYVLLQPTAGNVGIGTSAPIAVLDIAGTGEINVYGASAGRGLWMTKDSAGNYKTMRFAGNDVSFFSANTDGATLTTERLTVKHTTGYVGIGTTTPSALLHAVVTTATNNALQTVLTLGVNVTDTGVGAVGLGAGLLFRLESSTTPDTAAARIRSVIFEATHATRKFDLVGTAFDAGGEREGWRVRGNGSAPAIGFLGATPQARIAHVADPAGGATVDAEARSAINSILSTLELFGFHAAS